MGRLLSLVGVFARESDGQDLVEYGLLAALIAVVAFVAVKEVGSVINTLFWETFPSAI
jgi:Flp pilus assembly pilin Flp